MVLEGGVAGAQPLHKGGPKARPPIRKQGAMKSEGRDHSPVGITLGCEQALAE